MKKSKKIISLALSGMLALSMLSGCSMLSGLFGGANNVDNGVAPDYSDSNKQYTIWSYGSTCDDWYQVQGNRYYHKSSLQTKESTQLFADCGFNVLFIDWTFQYNGLGAANDRDARVIEIMDWAAESGMKCFIFASKLHALSSSETSLIVGEGKGNGSSTFDTQENLNAYVADILEEVKDHPAFYGVSLKDEPKYTMFPAMGEIYRAVQAAVPGAFCNMNINPYYKGVEFMYCPEGNSIGLRAAYKKYLDYYYEYVGQYCGYLQYDDYPIGESGVLPYHIENAQVVAEYCKEKGMQFGKVFQTCSYPADFVRRATTERDMWWQMHVGLAMGIKDFSYYTYYPTVNIEHEPDETAYIVNRVGEPTERYYWLQNIHKEMQFNAKALMNFEYQDMTYYVKAPAPGGVGHFQGVKQGKLTDIKNVTLDKESIILTTELFDAAKDQRGYYFVNTTDPTKTTDVKITVEIDGYNHVQIYSNGSIENKQVEDGKITFYLTTGDGIFMMPY